MSTGGAAGRVVRMHSPVASISFPASLHHRGTTSGKKIASYDCTLHAKRDDNGQPSISISPVPTIF
jgi:hypothetical protein